MYKLKRIISIKVIEGKSSQTVKGKVNEYTQFSESQNIPEDLFRRYTDTDSRPLTPSPTVTTIRTRTSPGSFLNSRRCITPELGIDEIIERKKIILDLRRSHSQETLYCKPLSEVSKRTIGESKAQIHQLSETNDKKSKQQKSDDFKQGNFNNLTILEEGNANEVRVQSPPPTQNTCINAYDTEDSNIRRGKRRKKTKPQPGKK